MTLGGGPHKHRSFVMLKWMTGRGKRAKRGQSVDELKVASLDCELEDEHERAVHDIRTTVDAAEDALKEVEEAREQAHKDVRKTCDDAHAHADPNSCRRGRRKRRTQVLGRTFCLCGELESF